MTEASLLPEAAAAAGISYPDLCARIIALSAFAKTMEGVGARTEANDEFSPKNFPNAQSAPLQCAATAAATSARCESSFPQSDATSHPQRAGRALEVGFGRGVVRSRLCRCARSRKTPLLRKSRLPAQTIELQTDGTLQREQVLKAADLHEGENIFSVNLARVRDRIQQLPQVDEVRGRAQVAERNRHSHRRAQTGRLDHQRKANLRSICLRWCFSGGRAGCSDERKEVVARISWTAADRGLLERIARGGQNCRIARSKNGARAFCV